MGEFFKAELKDRFLEYALERRDYFEIQTLYDEFLRPNYNLDFVERIIREIRDYDRQLLDVMSGNGMEMFMLASTPSTQDFLDGGGFLDMHVKEEEKWDKFIGQLPESRKLTRDEKEYLEKNSPALKKERTLLILLISAIGISFLFTVYGIVKDTFLEPQYVPMDDFERSLEKVRLQYQEENLRLNKELEQAKIIIDSLKK
ncbi:hypothetical protein [Flagellimonas allohymeniacidonis]|uniref:Uncharacterized protein n=1 Tax=Flagellimonas allohymeniacidonis TaxID=2517819 RepID=A0A4Q8QI46_9FLAO|nr:hypothetical protein [Allomuricauda hymeniacidonis]TAI49497.1 hypothetical protein EW142_06765 [Allomuricauda hymeniacidonis]